MYNGVTEIYIMQGFSFSSSSPMDPFEITNNITLIGGSEDAFIGGQVTCNTDNTNIIFKNLTLRQCTITLNATGSNNTVDFENVKIDTMLPGQSVMVINLNQDFYNEKIAAWKNMFTVSSVPGGDSKVTVVLTPKQNI